MSTQISTQLEVQTVDFKDPLAPKQFTQSLRETGFAVVRNHPISIPLIMETYGDWQHFFSLEEKVRYKYNPKTQDGYFPFRTENAKDSRIKDLKEFFHLYPYTDMPKGLSNRTQQLHHELTTLAAQLLGWIQTETPKDITSLFSMPLQEMIEGSDQLLLRILHYPPLDGAEEEGAIRAAAHEDINLITLLPAATAPGLQVKNAEGAWIDIACDPGSIVVNAGDMLQELSGRYYKSTSHQVVNPPGDLARQSRYSMPLFLHPRPEVPLSATHTAGSFLDQRLRENGVK